MRIKRKLGVSLGVGENKNSCVISLHTHNFLAKQTPWIIMINGVKTRIFIHTWLYFISIFPIFIIFPSFSHSPKKLKIFSISRQKTLKKTQKFFSFCLRKTVLFYFSAYWNVEQQDFFIFIFFLNLIGNFFLIFIIKNYINFFVIKFMIRKKGDVTGRTIWNEKFFPILNFHHFFYPILNPLLSIRKKKLNNNFKAFLPCNIKRKIPTIWWKTQFSHFMLWYIFFLFFVLETLDDVQNMAAYLNCGENWITGAFHWYSEWDGWKVESSLKLFIDDVWITIPLCLNIHKHDKQTVGRKKHQKTTNSKNGIFLSIRKEKRNISQQFFGTSHSYRQRKKEKLGMKNTRHQIVSLFAGNFPFFWHNEKSIENSMNLFEFSTLRTRKVEIFQISVCNLDMLEKIRRHIGKFQLFSFVIITHVTQIFTWISFQLN